MSSLDRDVRQCEAKGAAAAVGGLDPDAPAVRLDDPPADRSPIRCPRPYVPRGRTSRRFDSRARGRPRSRCRPRSRPIRGPRRRRDDLDPRSSSPRNLSAFPIRFCSTRRSWRGHRPPLATRPRRASRPRRPGAGEGRRRPRTSPRPAPRAPATAHPSAHSPTPLRSARARGRHRSGAPGGRSAEGGSSGRRSSKRTSSSIPASGSLRSCATTSAYPLSSASIRLRSVTSWRKTISPSPSFAARCTKVPSMSRRRTACRT